MKKLKRLKWNRWKLTSSKSVFSIISIWFLPLYLLLSHLCGYPQILYPLLLYPTAEITHLIRFQNSFLKILSPTWFFPDFNSNLFLSPTASIIIPKLSYQSPGQNLITCFKSWIPNSALLNPLILFFFK